MKRSEMISILTDLIYENVGVYGEFLGLDTSRVDKILDGLEEAGMLPPETTYSKCPDPDYYLKLDRTNFDSGMDYAIPTHFIAGWDKE